MFRLLIQEDDHGPDFIFGQEVLPGRHGRVPRSPLVGKARTAFRDPPEYEALGELCDGSAALEIRWGRIEAMSVVPLPVEAVTVTGQTALIVDALPLFVVLLQGAL